MPYSIRKNVLAMQPYSPGKPIDEVRRELGLENVVKLASNENPYGPSPKALAAVNEAAKEMHLYPDASAHHLKKAISETFHLPVNQIVIGNGSDEILGLLGLVFLGSPTDEVLTSEASFVRYDATAQVADCKIVKVPLTSDYRFDLRAMAAEVNENTKLIFIANPNNPTGTIVDREELDDFLSGIHRGIPVVLDEAYAEFAQEDETYPSSLEYIALGRPVVGLRTFSKAYGLAGIRLGYGFGPTEIIDALERVRGPFNANSLAQSAAVAALEDTEHLERTIAGNHEGREILYETLEAAGCTVIPSHTNFVMADLGRPAQPVFQALLEKGFVTRSGHVLGMPNFLRVSIGTPEEMMGFDKALREAMR